VKALIAGVEYSLESINEASLGDLYALKLQTKSKDFGGVSLKTISDTFSRVGQSASDPDFETLDLLDDEQFIINIVGVIFLARRAAGENITLDDARAIPFTGFQLVDDEEEEVAEIPLEVAAEELIPQI